MSGAKIFGASSVKTIPSSSWPNEIADGNIAGSYIWEGRGRAIVDSTERTIRGRATATTYAYLSTAVAMEVVSTSVNDTAAGTGARTVKIWGTDAAGAETIVTATMDGTTPVALTGTWLRIHRVEVITQGLAANIGQSNIGVITVQTTGAGAVHATILANLGASAIASFPVPAGKLAHLHHFNVSQDGNKAVDVRLYRRNGMLTSAAPFSGLVLIQEYIGGIAPLVRSFEFPVVIEELSDFFVTAQYAGGGTAIISVDFTIVVHDV